MYIAINIMLWVLLHIFLCIMLGDMVNSLNQRNNNYQYFKQSTIYYSSFEKTTRAPKTTSNKILA